MIIEKFIRNHPLEVDREDATRPIVSMQMPPLPTSSNGGTFLDSPAEGNLRLGALLLTLKRRRPRARRLVD
jgi:hypothetical protein